MILKYYFYILSILIIIVIPIYSDVSIHEILQEKCKENSKDIDAYHNILQSFDNCKKNFFDAEPFSNMMWSKVCHLIKNKMYNECAIPIMDSMFKCLTEEEKELIGNVEEAYNFTVTNYCQHYNNQLLMKLLSLIDNRTYRQCAMDYIWKKLPQKPGFKQLTIYGRVKYGIFAINFYWFCLDLKVLYHLVGEDVQAECYGQFQYTEELLLIPLINRCRNKYKDFKLS